MRLAKSLPLIPALMAAFLAVLVLAACTGEQGPAGPLPVVQTIEADLQPDPTTLVHQDLNGNKEIDPGEPFSVRAVLYTPGTNTKIGDFICDGVFTANVKITALDKAPTVTDALGGQFSAVTQTFSFAGTGSLLVIGSEPGTGPNNSERAVAGGTGQFLGATGVVRATPALGASLTPQFAADPVAGVPITFLSARVKFEIRRIAQ